MLPTETETLTRNSSSPPYQVNATHYCLLAIPLLALASSFQLSWQEVLRLAAVTLGLGLVLRSGNIHLRAGERAGEAVAGWAIGRWSTGILATALIFAMTQFDPLIQSVAVGKVELADYWFTIVSSILILAAGLITAQSSARHWGGGSLRLDLADRVVLFVGASVALISLGTLVVYGAQTELSPIPAVKVAQCLAIWLVVKWSYGPISTLGDQDQIRLESYRRQKWWRKSMILVILSFCVAILAGAGQAAAVFLKFGQAERLLADGDVNGAKKSFEQVRALNRSVGVAGLRDSVWNRLIAIYSQDKDPSQVGSLLEEIKDYHVVFAAHAKIGRAYERAGRIVEAMAEYRRAVECGSEEPGVVGKLSEWYMARDDLAEYAWLSRNAAMPVEIDTPDEGRSMFLGDVQMVNGSYQKAVDYYRKAIGSTKLGPSAWYKIGRAEVSDGSLRRSLDSFNNALALDPGFADAAYMKGQSHLSLGDTSAAGDAFRSALTMLPAHLRAARALADIVPDAELPFPAGLLVREMVENELGRDLLLVSFDLDSQLLRKGRAATLATRWMVSDMRLGPGIRLFLNLEFYDRASSTIYRAVNQEHDFERSPVTWQVGEVVEQTLSFTVHPWPLNMYRAGKDMGPDIARQTPLPAGCGYYLQLGLIYPSERRPARPFPPFEIEGLCVE